LVSEGGDEGLRVERGGMEAECGEGMHYVSDNNSKL
jgi:hypothetical protein